MLGPTMTAPKPPVAGAPPGSAHLPPVHPPVPPSPPPKPPLPPHPPHPPHPPVPPPPPAPVPAPPPGTPSITSWHRLEPRCRDAQMAATTSARVADPLWFLTRQWQLGEYQAEDAGSPVAARVQATSASLTRCHLGLLAANTQIEAAHYDPAALPLEALVERRPMRAADASDAHLLGVAVEAGLHFLRMLAAQPISKDYRAGFVAKFALQAQAAASHDDPSARFDRAMAGRAPDARRLAADIRAGHVAQWLADPALAIATGDRAEVKATATAWLAWYDALFSEPAATAGDAWDPARLEYGLTVSARLSDAPADEFSFSAGEFDDGRLDWSAFDFDGEVNLGTAGDHAFTSLVETTVPAPVTFRGGPAPRFWEMEDAQLAYGLVAVGPTDLAQLMMIEYASGYGNDWFLVPLTLPLGSVTRVDSLVVTDAFGVKLLLRPLGDRALPAANWSMWQHAFIRRPGEQPVANPVTNLFFLPPAAGRVLDGPVLEEVLFMRDEMANLAWAIERRIESPIELSVRRDTLVDAASNPPPTDIASGDATAASADPSATPRYRLASTVPDNWIPLMPIQTRDAGGQVVSRLRRGAVLQPDGSAVLHRALGRILNAANPLEVYDEEVPREGLSLALGRRLVRWTDGSTCVWTAYRRHIGRGEGSSGLRFDQVE